MGETLNFPFRSPVVFWYNITLKRKKMKNLTADELREMMRDAPDERTRQEFERFIQKIENM